MTMRLDKYLANMGVATRSQLKDMARAGRISVNGIAQKKTDIKIDEIADEVCVDGVNIAFAPFEYFMLNKPAGFVSARSDAFDSTVVELIPGRHRGDLFPVGRLDKDTVGLLLITNDGQLSHRLLSPNKHVDKVYEAYLDTPAEEKDIVAFQQGVDIGDEDLTLPAVLKIDEEDAKKVQITLREGRFHQVKRMCSACGKEVVYLKRLTMGPLYLDESLIEGESRALTKEELAALFEHTELTHERASVLTAFDA